MGSVVCVFGRRRVGGGIVIGSVGGVFGRRRAGGVAGAGQAGADVLRVVV